MSRQAHLPPRCPFRKKPISRPSYDAVPPFSPNESFPQHHKSFSQSSILEEQPDWLDDLLEDPAINSRGNFHRRSCSDSVALLDDLADSFSTHNDEENSVGSETYGGLDLDSLYGPNSPRRRRGSNIFENAIVSDLSETCAGLDSLPSHVDEGDSEGNETSCALESDPLYGPNSPRRRRSSRFLENAIVSALSENVPQYCLPYVDGNFGQSGTTNTVAKGDVCGSVGEPNAESNTAKRHPGPRSRVRKLQYIAELERRVNFLQALESELAVRIEDLLQRRVALSMENNKLKQKTARLQEEKFVMEDEYHSLTKEAERLKIKLANSPKSKAGTYYWSNPAAGLARSEDAWQMLDMSKLNLN